MSDHTISSATREVVRDLAVLSAGAAAGIYLYNLIKNHRRGSEAATPLIDTITGYREGVLSSIITFGWDEDEMFAWARQTFFDSEGHTVQEKLIEAEEYNRKILIVESDGLEDSGTPDITTIDLDPFGMGTSLSYRRAGGKEEHRDLHLDGGQLRSLEKQGEDYAVTWDAGGNMISVSSPDGQFSQDMTYYSHVANGVFPDINFLSRDLSVDFFSSLALGSRSSNLLSSMVIRRPGSHFHLLASYMCDRYDRPVQVRHETREITEGEVKESTLRYEIKYL